MYQIRSVSQSCPTLCNPMNHSMPGLPVHHQLPEFTKTHVHRVSDAIQPSHHIHIYIYICKKKSTGVKITKERIKAYFSIYSRRFIKSSVSYPFPF